jgi:tRNA pseudouridine38-40 synthase
MNYKLTLQTLQYDGTDFHGWQIQDDKRTVQGELTRALSLLDARDVTVHGSGRTDAGVHAKGQVASVHLEKNFSPEKLLYAVNGNLSQDVRLMNVEIAPDDFHARFSARGKTYVYRTVNSKVMSPFLARFAHQESRSLDIERMQSAASLFLGEHDWTAFSSAQTDASTRVRTITKLEVRKFFNEEASADVIEIEASADGFLRYMVRTIAGTLLAAGRGETNEEEIKQAIKTGNRPRAFMTAPAKGLTLIRVNYD